MTQTIKVTEIFKDNTTIAWEISSQDQLVALMNQPETEQVIESPDGMVIVFLSAEGHTRIVRF